MVKIRWKSPGLPQGNQGIYRAIAGSERLPRPPSKASERVFLSSQSSNNRLTSDDLLEITHRATLSAKNLMIIYDNSQGSLSRDSRCWTSAMATKSRPSFNPKSFLAMVGEGRSIGEYRKDPADAV